MAVAPERTEETGCLTRVSICKGTINCTDSSEPIIEALQNGRAEGSLNAGFTFTRNLLMAG